MGKFSSKRNKDFWNEFALTSKDNKFNQSAMKYIMKHYTNAPNLEHQVIEFPEDDTRTVTFSLLPPGAETGASTLT